MTAITPDAEALYASILANPADDGPRMVYADWLDGVDGSTPASCIDHELAQFIRGHVVRNLGPFVSNSGRAITFAYSPEIDFYVQAGDTGSVVVAPAIPGVTWIVRRGFVAEVRLPLATLMGGRCPSLGRIRSDISQDCPQCHGTGRVPGIAAALRRHPLERITLSDRERPYHSRSTGEYGWVLWAPEGDNTPVPSRETTALPWSLFSRLDRSKAKNSKHRSFVGYPDCEAALTALSAACLAFVAAAPESP